jgi:hypothetical protein
MASDSFTRADSGTLGANWASQTASTMAIVSNQAGGASANVHTDYYSAETPSNDQYSEATISGLGGSSYIGVAVRCSTSAQTSYALIVQPDGTALVRRTVAGTEADLATLGSAGFVNGNVARIEITGTTLVCKKGGVQIDSRTDENIASGRAGLWAYGTGGRADDWSGGSLSSSNIVNRESTRRGVGRGVLRGV